PRACPRAHDRGGDRGGRHRRAREQHRPTERAPRDVLIVVAVLGAAVLALGGTAWRRMRARTRVLERRLARPARALESLQRAFAASPPPRPWRPSSPRASRPAPRRRR